jgi:hypothetical protein
MSCPYTSPQNDKAKRMIRTTNDVMRSLLFQASLPTRYWGKSLYAATYFLNLLHRNPGRHYATLTVSHGTEERSRHQLQLTRLPVTSLTVPAARH